MTPMRPLHAALTGCHGARNVAVASARRPRCGGLHSARQPPMETAMDMLEPGRFGFAVNFKKRYGNYIGGQWVPPVKGEYFENVTPVTGRAFCEIPRSSAGDVELALDPGHAAKPAWGQPSPPQPANTLNKI